VNVIVLSLALVIAAAVCLVIGLFVVTDTLTFIFAAIGLCVVSLVLLWLGTRSRRTATPSGPSAPAHGSGVRAGGWIPAAGRRADGDADGEDPDALTDPDEGVIVRTVAPPDGGRPGVSGTPPAADADRTATDDDATSGADARKATGRAARRPASTGPVATPGSGGPAPATTGTTGAAARARLGEIVGVGPAKQDALLARYGSLEAIREASVDDIVANVRGFGEALASRVKDELS
jgi:membrane protein implicated in regulation of membrane protease activity